MSKNDKISITANHKRSLSVTSHHIENSINDIEKILTNNHGNNLTEKFIKNMNEETRKEILKLMGKVRRKNEKMFNELKLHSSMGAPRGCSGLHCRPKAGQSPGFFSPCNTWPAMQSGDSCCSIPPRSKMPSAS